MAVLTGARLLGSVLVAHAISVEVVCAAPGPAPLIASARDPLSFQLGHQYYDTLTNSATTRTLSALDRALRGQYLRSSASRLLKSAAGAVAQRSSVSATDSPRR